MVILQRSIVVAFKIRVQEVGVEEIKELKYSNSRGVLKPVKIAYRSQGPEEPRIRKSRSTSSFH